MVCGLDHSGSQPFNNYYTKQSFLEIIAWGFVLWYYACVSPLASLLSTLCHVYCESIHVCKVHILYTVYTCTRVQV